VAPPENNPYSEQTEHNTRTEWLNEQEPLDVELDGLTDYAANMKTLSENLRDLGATLNPLGTVPTQAWEGMVLEEMNYMRHRFLGNYAEFKQYLANLQMALMNIGMAAQTIADAYRGTDGWSAASVDAVRFAFGDRSVPPPGGLPTGINYQTYFDALSQMRQTGGADSDRPDAVWTPPERTEENGVVRFTSTNQYGETKVISQQLVPGQGYVTTITLTDRDGNVISESRQTSYSAYPSSYVYISGTGTAVTTNGETTVLRSSTTRVTDPDGGYTETTTEYVNDRESGTTTHVVDEDGNQVVTTTRPDGQGGDEVVREVHIGANTEGVTDPNYSPARRALNGLSN